MTTKCAVCPLRQKDMFQKMTAEDVRVMERFKVGEMQVDAATPLLMEGSNAPQLYTALRGMGLRYKILPDGRRQVINMVMPGDFIGLQAAMMGEMKHSVEATTRMTLCVFDRSEMYNFVRSNPERSFALIWLAAVEEHLLGDALATIGQRSAEQSVAWAFVRLYARAERLDLVHQNAMPLPYRQQDLADALGLSLVHTNRVIRTLRSRQLATWSDGRLLVPDLDALAAVADMDSTQVEPRPLM